MSENIFQEYTYDGIRTYVKHNMKTKTPYRPLVLKFLLQAYPDSKSKEELSDFLRSYFKESESYSQLLQLRLNNTDALYLHLSCSNAAYNQLY